MTTLPASVEAFLRALPAPLPAGPRGVSYVNMASAMWAETVSVATGESIIAGITARGSLIRTEQTYQLSVVLVGSSGYEVPGTHVVGTWAKVMPWIRMYGLHNVTWEVEA